MIRITETLNDGRPLIAQTRQRCFRSMDLPDGGVYFSLVPRINGYGVVIVPSGGKLEIAEE
jgi:hypothetical protein